MRKSPLKSQPVTPIPHKPSSWTTTSFVILALSLALGWVYQQRFDLLRRFYAPNTYLNKRSDVFKIDEVWNAKQQQQLIDFLKN